MRGRITCAHNQACPSPQSVNKNIGLQNTCNTRRRTYSKMCNSISAINRDLHGKDESISNKRDGQSIVCQIVCQDKLKRNKSKDDCVDGGDKCISRKRNGQSKIVCQVHTDRRKGYKSNVVAKEIEGCSGRCLCGSGRWPPTSWIVREVVRLCARYRDSVIGDLISRAAETLVK
ncbi:hypothetical protein DFH29DRAFT_921373 [Suillus ampliporus]|nr:hypothetical protein DFH29DRAFT_921373 [Suillus ampliporus]